MKKLYLFAIAVLALICVVQAQERQLLTVSVPFSFTAENSNFPAGSYRVYLMNPNHRIRVESAEGKSVIVGGLPHRTLSEAAQAGFVFHHIGGQYFLVEVREQSSNVQRDVPLGRLARELAKKNSDPRQVETIISAANR